MFRFFKYFHVKFFKLSNRVAKKMASNLLNPENEALVSPDVIEKWNQEQNFLKEKLILNDVEPWQTNLIHEEKIYKLDELDKTVDINEFYKNRVRYVAGLDLSYIKENDDLACAGLIVLDAADNLKVIYEDINMVNISTPYVPGYLAFREVPFLVEKLNKLKLNNPEIYPQCIFIDGNGLLHPKRFGLACHLGVLIDTPTIGIAKQLFQVDGLEKNEQFKSEIKEKLKKKGDYIELKSNNESKDLLGLCFRSTSENPIYVSIGHKISWKTCILLLNLIITKYRIPEPTRLADLRTREYIRVNIEGKK
jgi:deoxyinosine 3'endonuclease (endonuclease V)